MVTKSRQAYKDALLVLEALESANKAARLVGGCVRDRQLGLEPKDFDITTDATPTEMMAIFKKYPWKVVPTGIEHGTLTVVTKFGPIEVTTLRHDVHLYQGQA